MKCIKSFSAFAAIASLTSLLHSAPPVQWRAADGGNNHWYEGLVVQSGISWTAARDAALARGGYLAAFSTAAEADWVFSHVSNAPNLWSGRIGPWIGLRQNTGSPSYTEPAGGFEWVDGTPLNYSRWAGGEPANNFVGQSEGFVNYLGNVGANCTPVPVNAWNDLPENGLLLESCAPSAVIGFVVEYDVVPPQQFTQWTVESGGNGHWYEVVKVPAGITWPDARNGASARGGYLATLTSSAENNFVFDNILSNPIHWSGWAGPWIGLWQNPSNPNYSEPAGGYEWVTGEPVTYTSWSAGEPSNGTAQGENSVHLIGSVGVGCIPIPQRNWNDRNGLAVGGDACAPSGVTTYLVEYNTLPSACSAAWVNRNINPGTRWLHAQAFDPIGRKTVIFGGRNAGNTVIADTRTWNGSAWTPYTGSGPSARSEHAMSTNTSLSGVLLFGGRTETAFFDPSVLSNQTWRWSGAGWVFVTSAGPSPRASHAMALDTLRNKVVLFGGYDGSGQPIGDTWEWNGTSWTQIVVPGPSARFGHSMAYDPIRQRIVLTGGFGSSNYADDTWEFDGTSWTLGATGNPTRRMYSAAAFDPQRSRVVQFGGWLGAQDVVNDLYSWTGSAWQIEPLASPPGARKGAVLTFDPPTNGMLLTGGGGVDPNRFGDTWQLSSGPVIVQQPASLNAFLWDVVSFSVVASGPSLTYQWRKDGFPLLDGGRFAGARSATLVITDLRVTDQGMYDCVVGGTCSMLESSSASLFIDCTPRWSQRSDTTIGPRWLHASAFDPVTRKTMIYGGRDAQNNSLATSYLWNGSSWTSVSGSLPGARAETGMCTSVGQNGLILFGGRRSGPAFPVTTTLNDTWRWNGSAWSQYSPPNSPSARAGHAMAYDSSRNRVVLFGGFNSGDAILGDTWEFDGTTWTQRATSGPAPRFAASMAFDPNRGKMVLTGGYATGLLSDTWEWNGSSWTQIVTAGPLARFYSSAAYDATRGRVVVFGGWAGGTTILNDLYSWTGTAWQNEGAITPPSPRYAQAMSYDATLGGLVLTGGNGLGTVRFSDTWQRSNSLGIDQQPTDVALQYGQPASFTVHTIGSVTSYQWRKNGQPIINSGRISGAQAATLIITSMRCGDQGVYDCVLNSDCGNTTSDDALLSGCCADIGRSGGLEGSDGLLDNNEFVVFINWFFSSDTRADRGSQGGVSEPDGLFTSDDFIVYIDQFFSGC